MKVIAINGSPKKNGNTNLLLNKVLDELKKEGIDTEIIQLGGKNIHGCTACQNCKKNKNKKCAINDVFNDIFQKTIDADAIIIGSPTYFANVTTEVKAFIDRAGLVARGNGFLYKRKIGSAVVAVRRAGSIPVFDAINKLFFANEMIVPGSSYWNLGIGGAPGDVENDDEGITTMNNLGKNIAWLLKKLN